MNVLQKFVLTTYSTAFIFMTICVIKSEFTPQTKASSSFEEALKSKTFVDKSLLIREIFKSPLHTNLITLPRKFGKSTNMDMIRRFCQFEIDENGNPKQSHLASNYNLFKENKLKIFEDENIVKEHMASHPVIYLDYTSLHGTTTYENLVEKLVKLISQVYSKHKYLLKNNTLWSGFDKGLFESYISAGENHSDHNLHILTSLKWLCEILHKNFGRRVLILIDEYDAYVQSAIFEESKDFHKIHKLMHEIDGNLLKPHDHSSKVILSGSLKVIRSSGDTWSYHFLEDHPFSPYYGITEQELDNLLQAFLKTESERAEVKKSVVDFYSSYKLFSGDGSATDIYCYWPVTHLIMHRNHPEDYLIRPEYIEGFKSMLRSQKVKEVIHGLVAGEPVYVERSAPFYEENIITLNNIVKFRNCTAEDVEFFSRLLFSLGYLTPEKENRGLLLEEFKIPNKALHDELVRYTPC